MRLSVSLFGSWSALLFALICIASPNAQAAENARPFWTEKSSYIEGDTLYCVGVTTKAGTKEMGRQSAHENGKRELSNFAQITDLSGLTIETQMTYEEQNSDGTFNVYRLLKVDMGEVTKWNTRLMARATEEMEKQSHEVAKEIARKKIQVDNLARQSAELADLDARAAAINGKIQNLTTNVQKYLRCGMAMAEVKELLGNPRAAEGPNVFGATYWNYGEKWLKFENGILMNIGHNEQKHSSGIGCP